MQELLSKIFNELGEIKADLKHHIRRTNLLEEKTTVIRKELAPIKTHIAVVAALAKIAIGLVAITGSAFGIYKAML